MATNAEIQLTKKRSEYNKLLTDCQKFMDEAPKNGDDWKADHHERYAKFDTDLSDLDEAMQALSVRIERDARMEKRIAAEAETAKRDLRENPEKQTDTQADKVESVQDMQVRAFLDIMKNGPNRVDASSPEQIAYRAYTAGNQVSAGYWTVPEKMSDQIIKEADDAHLIRQLATVLPPLRQVHSLGVLTDNQGIDDFEWTTEIKDPVEGADATFGKREFVPHPAEKLIKISRQLINMAPNFEPYLRGRILYVQGNTQENAFMTGDGNKKPLGLFVPSDDGIPTSRDFSESNTTTKVTADNLIGAQGEIKTNYTNRRWLFHRNLLTMIRRIKDDGNYIFRPGLEFGAPSTLLGERYILSEFAPKTFTTGKYAYLYGDFKYYWIVDGPMASQVFIERPYGPKFTGYWWQFHTEGQPVLGEAFLRGKFA